MRLWVWVMLLLVSAEAAAFRVTMKAESDGKGQPTISGETNLPDGIGLVVTVRRTASGFAATAKAVVKGGVFQVGPFNQQGGNLNPGNYILEVNMPLASTQPPRTWPTIGNDGEHLDGPLVKRSPFGDTTIEYKTSFPVGDGNAQPDLDKAAREQAQKDRHKRWVNGCKDSCNTAYVYARQRGANFDFRRCYYKCVADEPKSD